MRRSTCGRGPLVPDPIDVRTYRGHQERSRLASGEGKEMLDLRTALEDAHSIIASIDDDCGD